MLIDNFDDDDDLLKLFVSSIQKFDFFPSTNDLEVFLKRYLGPT